MCGGTLMQSRWAVVFIKGRVFSPGTQRGCVLYLSAVVLSWVFVCVYILSLMVWLLLVSAELCWFWVDLGWREHPSLIITKGLLFALCLCSKPESNYMHLLWSLREKVGIFQPGVFHVTVAISTIRLGNDDFYKTTPQCERREYHRKHFHQPLQFLSALCSCLASFSSLFCFFQPQY